MMAHSFTFNSVDMGDYGLYIPRGFYPSFLAKPHVPAVRLARDGAVAGPSDFDPATISFEAVINAASSATLETYRLAIVRALATREDAELSFDMRSGVYWNARPNGISFEGLSPRRLRATIDFLALDPFGYASSATTVSPTLTVTGGQAVECTVGGEIDAYPTVEVTVNATTGSCAIENEDTEERFTWTTPSGESDLVSGDKIYFDTNPRYPRVRVRRVADDAYADSSGADGQPFGLAAGAATNLVCYGMSGSCTITFRSRFL